MAEEIFMKWLAFGIIIFMIYLGLMRFFQKYPIDKAPFLMSPSNSYSIKELLKFLIHNKETRNKLLATVGILIFYQTCTLISLPGVNRDAIVTFFQSISGNLSIMYYGGGALSRISVFALGIMPFISACLLIQLSSVVIPHIRRATFGGEEGRSKIVRYTYILVTVLALVQSYYISLWLENPAHFQGIDILTMKGLPFRLTTMMTLTGSVLLLLFLANCINKYGIGNGIAMIIISGILRRYFSGALQTYNVYFIQRGLSIFSVMFVLVILVGFLYAAFYFTNREKKFELKDKTTQREFTIPLKISWVSDVPIAFAQSIVLLPATIAAFVINPVLHKIAELLSLNSWLDIAITGIFIFLFTYVYALVVFKPKNVTGLLEKYNFSSKSTDEKNTEKLLDDNLSKLLIITALSLFILNAAPAVMSKVLALPYFIASLAGGTTILILAGVFSDLLKQIEFFSEKSKLPDKNLTIAYIAFAEIEAKIKSEYLKGKGINALVEPLRFTWGLPIRTAVDKYRIYTPADRVKEARQLIGF